MSDSGGYIGESREFQWKRCAECGTEWKGRGTPNTCPTCGSNAFDVVGMTVEAPEGAAPAVSREASVPQGGEFTAAEVEKAAEHVAAQFLAFGLRTQADKYDRMLRAYARALSSAPGERT
jgi:predicted  nucleic acid-binding Zn-ribbon protein